MKRIFALAAIAMLAACGGGDAADEAPADSATTVAPVATDTAMAPPPAPMDSASMTAPAPMDSAAMTPPATMDSAAMGDTTKKM